MPLMAKEVRLTQGDTVIARASSAAASRAYRTGSVSETVQLDAQKTLQKVDEPLKVRSKDDYYTRIHRNPNGAAFRWAKLPINVYVKSTMAEMPLTQQAIHSWQNGFSVTTTTSLQQADVIISWDKADWDQNPSTLLTRPVVRMGDSNNIRTVVLVTLYPVRNSSPDQLLHIVSHQLGHAFGLWGHSDDPDDLMYPALKWEISDFPTRWRWRSDPTNGQSSNAIGVTEPSQRDVNTLLRVYDQPANDLSAYTP
jgi:predicted Zn-dependent protease